MSTTHPTPLPTAQQHHHWPVRHLNQGCAALRSRECDPTHRTEGPRLPMAGYVEALRQVFIPLHRVLVPSGTVWLHLHDGSTTTGTPLGMPWRVALTLQAHGRNLRNAIICHHPTTRIRDRLTCRYRLLVRQPRYFFDLDPIRAHHTGDRPLSRRAHHRGSKPHTATGTWPPPGLPQGHPPL